MSEEQQLTFIDPTEHIRQLKAHAERLETENRLLTAIYHAAEMMTMRKDISSVEEPELWEAFHAFDGGRRKATITADDAPKE